MERTILVEPSGVVEEAVPASCQTGICRRRTVVHFRSSPKSLVRLELLDSVHEEPVIENTLVSRAKQCNQQASKMVPSHNMCDVCPMSGNQAI